MKRKSVRKTLIVALALMVAVAMIPSMAFAQSGDGTATEWGISKSKTATNLDENFESEVTLSLPAAEEQLVSDVVFVFDESSCSEPVKEKVNEMLDSLYKNIAAKGAVVKIGAVQFRGEVTTFPLTELTNGTKSDISEFIETRPETGGSNMSAGLIAGEKMLDADDSVTSDRKYLILVSDAITYIWDDETTEEQENYGVNFANADTKDKPMLASPDGMLSMETVMCQRIGTKNWKK